MAPLDFHLLSTACQIFLAKAYPRGLESIPTSKHAFAPITEDSAPPNPPWMRTSEEGFAIRLGSERFPFLQLKILLVHQGPEEKWVFSVDTHDQVVPPVQEAEEWREFQISNQRLKENIESEWEKNGLLTFNSLLKQDL